MAQQDIKYFTEAQIKRIRKHLVTRLNDAKGSRRSCKAEIRQLMAFDILINTGLRCFELANLKCGDLKLGYDERKIYVRRGKRNISAHVSIPPKLKEDLKKFLKWKQKNGELVDDEAQLFLGERGPWTKDAVAQFFRDRLNELDMREPGKNVHALRHSFAMQYYKKTKDIMAVKKQMRHLNLRSTMVYATTTDEDIREQTEEGIW